MDLRQLRTFVHVAELGSISAAAERLHVAQPALSRQLQALERDLGVRLLQRHGRGVALTEAGSHLLARSTNVLHALDEIREELRETGDASHGQVSFALPPTVAEVLCGPLVERFSRRFPQVRLSISTGFSGYVLDWLQRGLADVAVLYDVAASPTLRLRPLAPERLYLVEPAAGGAHAPVPVAELARRPMILPRPQHGLRRVLDMAATRLGLTLVPVIEVDSLPLQLDLVRRGFGATVLPLAAVHAEIAASRLMARPLVAPQVTRQLVLATPLDQPLSRATRHFVEAVEQTARHLAETGLWRHEEAPPMPAEHD